MTEYFTKHAKHNDIPTNKSPAKKPAEDSQTPSDGKGPSLKTSPTPAASKAIAKKTKLQNDYSLNVPEEIIVVQLASGKPFYSQAFDVDVNSVRDALKDKVEKQSTDENFIGNPVLLLSSPNDQTQAWAEYDNAKLDGIYLAFYRDNVPVIYANYTDGSRNGIFKYWNEHGQRVYWCRYVKSVRNGFCCYFKDDVLRILLEINRNKVTAVHLCNNSQLAKSFDSPEQASADENAKVFMDELNEIESQLMKTEAAYKKQFRYEEQRIRQQKAAKLNEQRRDSIIDRMNQRGAQRQAEIDALRRKGGGM